MDAFFLARIKFAVTVGFHFIFPSLTIGLAWLVVVAEGLGWLRKDEGWGAAGRLFGKLLAITFAAGVATGIVMEFQFGTDWARYSKFVGDIFGAPLAAEAIFAFFLESAFMGLYLFGRGRVPAWLHWFSSLMVAVGATISAFFIIVANSWQQTPAGHIVTGTRAELVSFYDAVFNPSTLERFTHTMVATLIAGAFLVVAVAAWHLQRNPNTPFARKAMKLGVVSAFIFSMAALFPTGHASAVQVAKTQPEKLAAIEGLVEGQERAPMLLFGIPKDGEINAAVGVPGLLSWLATGDWNARVKGLKDFPPEDRPPMELTFVSFHTMVALGMLFIALSGLALLRLVQGKLFEDKWLLRGLLWAVPLPVIACQLGWMTAEVGRQPWVVYRLLRTAEANSTTVSAGQVAASLVVLSLIYVVLGALWLWLMVHKARRGPEGNAPVRSK